MKEASKLGLLRMIDKDLRMRDDKKAFLMFFSDIIFYISTLVATIYFDSIVLKLIFGLLNGLSIGLLFIIGHDCCHGVFFKSKWMNKFVGQICFTPSFTPMTSWYILHNVKHHRYTNFSKIDNVWAPLSYSEYLRLNWFGKLLYRIYRNPLGQGVYYFYEMWWKELIFVSQSSFGKYFYSIRKEIILLCLVNVCIFITTVSVAYVSMGGPLLSVSAKILVFSFILPFVFWNYIMAYFTYLQHTHPQVKWYDSKEEWSFFKGQIEGTVFVRFPNLIDSFFHRIMHHNAHHVDVSIPLYNLMKSQSLIMEHFSPNICQNYVTPVKYIRDTYMCKLYDYQNHKWLSYDGTVVDSKFQNIQEFHPIGEI